ATAAAAAQRPVQPGRAGQHPAQRSQGRAGVHARPPLQGGRVNSNDETYDQVRVTTLDNGLRVATDPMATVDTVSLGIWAGVGTRNEPKEINGVAHLLEHMAFKGTERRSARDIAVEIEAVGGHLNAYTSREQTAYYAKVLAEDVP